MLVNALPLCYYTAMTHSNISINEQNCYILSIANEIDKRIIKAKTFLIIRTDLDIR